MDDAEQPKRTVHRAPDRLPRRMSTRLPMGTLITLFTVVLAFIALLWWQRPITIAAPPGKQLTVHLPDGSTVELNSQSRLQYPRGFQEWPFLNMPEKVVDLEGEAFFQVVHGERPFVVRTFNARVEVLGTEFNVLARATPSENATRVTLASGVVRVSGSTDSQASVTLKEAGQTAFVGEETAHRPLLANRSNHLVQVLAWRQQGFYAADQPLATILIEIERRFDLDVEVAAGIDLTDAMNLYYGDRVTVEAILHDICLIQGCRYRKISGGYMLYLPEQTPSR